MGGKLKWGTNNELHNRGMGMEFIKIKTIWSVDLLKRGATIVHRKSCTY